jgi:RNA polymerase sigma-70 factor (ECF subfamily)
LESTTQSQNQTDEELLQAGYRYAVSMTHHPEDAEDLVQEGWLNLCRRYGRVESRAVLFTTVRNLFIDQCRRRKIVAFESLDQEQPPALPPAPAEEPGVKGDLEKLLAILRPNEREMLFLHYHQGHTAEEIGQMTGQPRGTVLSLLHRAIGKLRAAAAGEGGSSRCNQWLLFFVLFV